MSTLTKRQSPLDDTGTSYDDYDSYGYDPSTCYQDHTCSWWWSSVSPLYPLSLVHIPSTPIHTTPLHIANRPQPHRTNLSHTDRLRSPLHHSIHPLLPPNSLLRRRLPARPRTPTQKPPPARLPPLDGEALQQPSSSPQPPALPLQPARPPDVQPEPVLWTAATTSGHDRNAGRDERAAAAGLQCWGCAATGLPAACWRE